MAMQGASPAAAAVARPSASPAAPSPGPHATRVLAVTFATPRAVKEEAPNSRELAAAYLARHFFAAFGQLAADAGAADSPQISGAVTLSPDLRKAAVVFRDRSTAQHALHALRDPSRVGPQAAACLAAFVAATGKHHGHSRAGSGEAAALPPHGSLVALLRGRVSAIWAPC